MRPLRSLLFFVFCAAFVMIPAVPPALAEGPEPARVLLRAETAPDGTLQVTAMVVDARGAPVADVPLTLKARATFGWLTFYETTTGKDGIARTTLVPGTAAGEITAEAGEDGNITAAILVGEKKTAPPRIRPGRDVLRRLSPQPGFISPYPVPLQVVLFGLILGGIWVTYGYVAWALLRIAKGSRERP